MKTIIVFSILLGAMGFADENGCKLIVRETVQPRDFVLCQDGAAAPIYIASDLEESLGVIRAAADLQQDVCRVTGVTPSLVHTVQALSKSAILIGTIGKSTLIDELIESGKLDVEQIKDQWEAYVIQTVENPVPGVESGLVIAGSDPRGSIYGIYELSEKTGVSPWYYWADVPPKKKSTVAVASGVYKQGAPAVAYRGIFINDEFNLADWAYRTLGEKKFMGPEVYARVFELLLRLKANYLWPAMHSGASTDFNTYPENPRLADEYGIVIGSSHCEPMLRSVAQEEPWIAPGVDRYDEEVRGPYDYSINPHGVYEYFDENARDRGRYESSWTLGMRGLDDGEMINAAGMDASGLLGSVIKDQQQILRNRVNPDLNQVLQVFCPYKEVLDIYNQGLPLPDDICLLWPDDNHGYLRQVLSPEERRRRGGGGVYYHLSVWNSRGSFLWLDSTTLGLIWSEMTKAYQCDMKRVWVVNVGDIKPAEVNMEFFLKLGWDPERWNGINLKEFYRELAARDFSPAYQDEIADLLGDYYSLAEACRPEFSQGALFSHLLYGDEAMKRIDAYEALTARAQAVAEKLPAEQQDAFYELVLYKIKAGGLFTKAMILESRSQHYFNYRLTKDVRPVSDAANRAMQGMKAETEFYNKEVAGGKWNRIMHPFVNQHLSKVPKIPSTITKVKWKDWGLHQGDSKLAVLSEGDAPLSFSCYTQDKRFIDIHNVGGEDLLWQAEISADWIQLTKRSGTTPVSERIWVEIDWAKAPPGTYKESITVHDGKDAVLVDVLISNPVSPRRDEVVGYIESHGYIAIEAEHFSRNLANGGCEWKPVDYLGRNGGSMCLFPASANSILNTADAPCLEYQVYFEKAGKRALDVYRNPSWNLNVGTRIAVGLDDETLQRVGNPDGMPPVRSAKTRVEICSTVIDVPTPGYHTLKVYMVDPSVSIDRIIIGNYKKSYFGPPESYHANSCVESGD